MRKEHDITKSMLDSIREVKKNNYIKHLTEELTDSKSDILDLDNQAYKDEQNKFMEMVSSNVEFGSFKIYPSSNNVTFSGKLDNGIEWQFSKVDGLYISAPNMKVDDEVIEILKKINAYFTNWVKEWGIKLNTEYK